MSYQFNTSRAYLAFDFVVRNIESWLISKIHPQLGYSATTISSRVVQRFVELGLFSFIHNRAGKHEVEWNNFAILSEPLKLAGVHVSNVEDELKVKLDKQGLLRALFDFSVHWFHVLAIVLINSFKPTSKVTKPSTLIFGLGTESIIKYDDDVAFLNYCKTGPISPLNSAKSLIVQSTLMFESTQGEYVSYSRFPLMRLLERNPPTIRQAVSFLRAHISAAIAYFRLVRQCPLASFIGRDFAYHAMVEYLNKNSLIESLIITNSNYSSQPLWMRPFKGRNFTTHMVLYSQNTIPFVYKDDPVSSPLPNNRHVCVDEWWVWTKNYAEYLGKIGVSGKRNIVGPVVWYTSTIVRTPSTDNIVKVTIFDVTPVTEEYANNIGMIGNYYSAGNCIKFIQDLVTVIDSVQCQTHISIEIYLKHKRAHHSLHSHEYLDVVQHLLKSGHLKLVNYEADIFELISSSDLVVVIPYSSPVIIANVLDVPSIYFDATQELLPEYETLESTFFASGKDELNDMIMKIINKLEKTRFNFADSKEAI